MTLIGQSKTALLVSDLWTQVRNLADRRDVELDLRLLGKPGDLSSSAREILSSTMASVIESAGGAEELHHLGLELSYQADSLSVRIEHDGTLDGPTRSLTEQDILAHYADIGALGGTLALSSGRGFGLRLELTLPYANEDATIFPVERFTIPPSVRGATPVQAHLALPVVLERLTPQEETTLSLLAAGLSNKEIASQMNLGVGTVKFHLAQIYQKLGVQGRGRGAAVARARELGLLFD